MFLGFRARRPKKEYGKSCAAVNEITPELSRRIPFSEQALAEGSGGVSIKGLESQPGADEYTRCTARLVRVRRSGDDEPQRAIRKAA